MLKSSQYRNFLFLFACLALTVFTQTAKDDQVHFPIPGYNEHKWFSGIFILIKVISISIWENSITYSSSLKETLKMILYYYGSMEDPVAAA